MLIEDNICSYNNANYQLEIFENLQTYDEYIE